MTIAPTGTSPVEVAADAIAIASRMSSSGVR